MRDDSGWFDDENESYYDFKCEDVVFPNHNEENLNGEVITYYLDIN